MTSKRKVASPIGGGEDQASPVPAALSRLNQAGVEYKLIPVDPCYSVGGFVFWPGTGRWREANINGTRCGYGVDKLIAAIKQAATANATGLQGVAAAMAEPQP